MSCLVTFTKSIVTLVHNSNIDKSPAVLAHYNVRQDMFGAWCCEADKWKASSRWKSKPNCSESNPVTVNGLFFMYRSLEYVIFTSCNLCPLRRVILYCNVGWCIKDSAVHHHQQCLVAEWLGLSVTVRVRVTVRARGPGNGIFLFFFFFFFCLC